MDKQFKQVNEMDTYPHPDSKEGKKLMRSWKSSAKKHPTDSNAPSKRPTTKQTFDDLLPKLNKAFKKSIKVEDVAVNNVGGGNVAGLGVGPQGEPPKHKALLSKVKTMLKRKVPNVGAKSPS